MFRTLALAGAMALALVATPVASTVSMAQEVATVTKPEPDVISLAGPLVYVIGLIASGVLVLGGWGLAILRGLVAARLGDEIADRAKDTFQDALEWAVDYARDELEELAHDAKVTVHNPTIAKMVRYVVTKLPGIMEDLDLTENDVAEMLVARVNRRKSSGDIIAIDPLDPAPAAA